MSNLTVWFKSGEVVTFENVRAFYFQLLPIEHVASIGFYFEEYYSRCDMPANIEVSRIESYVMNDVESFSYLMEPGKLLSPMGKFSNNPNTTTQLYVWFRSGRVETYNNLLFRRKYTGIMFNQPMYAYVYEDPLDHTKYFGTFYLDCVEGYVVTETTRSNRNKRVIDREGVITTEQFNSVL